MTVTSVPDDLRAKAAIYEERNKIYGDNYKRHGAVMEALFPTGIELHDIHDHNRFGVFTQVIAKITRYAENFQRGGHVDSIDDMIVYAAMLKELDAIEQEAMAYGVIADGEPELTGPASIEIGAWTFPDAPAVPTKPVVFDDSELALTTQGGNLQPVAEEPPAPVVAEGDLPEAKTPPKVL